MRGAMHKLKIVVSFFFVMLFALVSSAYSQTYWANYYDLINNDSANSIKQTTDGGFVVAGYSNVAVFGYDYDYWILKLAGDGTVTWQKTYSGVQVHSQAQSIQQTTDGGYIVAGTASSFGSGDSDYWILKLSESAS